MKNIFGKYCMVVLGLMLAVVLHAEKVLLSFYADGVPVLENYETESGVAVTLSSIVSNPANCRGYNFVGWKSGSPVTPGETPTTVTSVTPTVNMNFYAVYQRAGGVSNRYTRITSVRDLRAGSQYLLVCYYDHDGEIYYGPSYFAMKNVQSNNIDNTLYPTGETYETYFNSYDVYATRYSILTEQIFPDGGVYDDPVNSIIWTLGGSEDAWTLTNGNQSLKICDGYYRAYYLNGDYYYSYGNYNHQILANPGNSFVISSTNGTFNFKANGYYLTYSDDEEDYFKMGESNDWDFYLYKKEDPYTSYPDCRTWTVHLDAVDGTIGNTGLHKQDMEEHGAGVVLPAATKPAGAACDEWGFAGWLPETPLRGTTNAPKLYPAGSTYKPVYDGETLYAVYTTTKYTRQTSSPSSGTYVIVANTGANYYAMGNEEFLYANKDYRVEPTPITLNASNEIVGEVAPALEWTYASSQLQNVGNTSVYVNPKTTSGDKHVIGAARPLSFSYSGGYWAIYNGRDNLTWTNDKFSYINSNSFYRNFYLYKKIPGSYSSYPHCTTFRVNLHGCGGAIGGIDGPFEMSDEETTIGGGITLPSIVVPVCDEAGEEWTFEGWQEGGDVELIEDVRYTGLLSGTYVPDRDEIDLYAVFKHKTNKYDIIYNPVNMESGDEYIITGYDNVYDWAITTETYDANHLKGIQTASPQGIEGYYVMVDDLRAVWKMDGTYTSCTFQNVADPTAYLASNTSGHTMTAPSGSETTYAFTIHSSSSGFSYVIQETETGYYLIFNSDGTTSYFSTGASSGAGGMFIYRRIKEYSSWPHCEAFTVLFDKGTGTVAGNITSMSEGVAYEGVTLPNAYANVDCAKEGWTFAGWSTMPVTVESDALSVDLLPAGAHYRIPSDNKTLYAVYFQPENTYQRVTSMDDLKTGVNYIITKNINSTSAKALGNTYKAGTTDYITAVDVALSGNAITNITAAIDWRLMKNRYGEFEWFNVSDSVYLDLRAPGKAKLTSNEAKDNFEIFYSSGFVVRSIQSLEHYSKYLGYDASNNRFTTTEAYVDSVLLYIYQQEAVYHSSPSCSMATDVVDWSYENGETYMYLESFVLGSEPTMPGGVGYPVLQDDGTFKFKYRMDHCTTTLVRWDGTRTNIRIPYILDKAHTNASDSLVGDCSECDVVVLSGNTLTIDEDKTVHSLTVQEGATLNIAENVTLTVNSLILGAKGDQNAPKVNINTGSSIILSHDELYYDLRIPTDRFYWFSLPFNSNLTEISYSNEEANGGIPEHWTNYYVYFYNGKLRSDDANGGAQANTYWNPVSTGADYTMRPGQGYLMGLPNSEAGEFNSQGYDHTKRVMRFTMRPPESTWLNDERLTGFKIGPVSGAIANNPRNAVHMGWNLIGNPYMHTYELGDDVSGLLNGAWEKEKIGDYETKYYILKEGTTTVPYITLYDPSTDTYEQVLANGRTLRPFEAVFVQVQQGTGIKFENEAMSVPSSAPSYIRRQQQDAPVRTGITLSGVGGSDKTGFVLSDEYTEAYEIGADLQKMFSPSFNIYSLNADNQELAFNGMSEEDAVSPIPLGYYCLNAGEYTFSFDDTQYRRSDLESLTLIDYSAGVSKDLLNEDYTVTLRREINNSRFAIVIRLAKAPEIATGVDNIESAGNARKVIRNGHLFIVRDNDVYNAVGTKVK